MKKVTRSGFDVHLDRLLRKHPDLADAYAKQFAGLPVPTQLAVMRRRRWLSQENLAKESRVKQPHVARLERADHDPRLSSILNQAQALRCHLLVVPNELLGRVARIVALGQRPAGN